MTDAAECRREATAGPPADADSEVQTDTGPDSEAVAAEIRNRAERVRRRELDKALGRLEARGDLTPEQRRVVADLSAAVADALVERWTARVAGEDDRVAGEDTPVDAEIARDLLTG